ncbi:hypothetical protein O4G76_19435, partial [Limimaricola sp. G21655-S1]|nr:hypothetical protein [Limimaricola sp. G21655-S1]
MYCINPLNFFKLILRLFKWALYIVFGAIALGMLTLAIGNYAHAAEWVPADKSTDTVQNTTSVLSCSYNGLTNTAVNNQPISACITKANSMAPTWKIKPLGSPFLTGSDGSGRHYRLNAVREIDGVTGFFTITMPSNYDGVSYICPPAGKPQFTVGPKVTENGTVCEKKPLQCLLGSVKDTNAITGKEFCRPICEGIAGNTYGTPDEPVSYFTSNFGTVKITCYGQCSVKSVGGAINPGGNPNIWMGVIQFTGENCPIQTNGNAEDSSTAGVDTPVTPPGSSDSTNDAQNNLDGAVSDALGNTTSGATGTA